MSIIEPLVGRKRMVKAVCEENTQKFLVDDSVFCDILATNGTNNFYCEPEGRGWQNNNNDKSCRQLISCGYESLGD